MRIPLPRTGPPRRGLTLIEMLVVVALVVLMMTILVQIFSAATDAISISRTFQELDGRLRMLDTTIRRDLAGVTARMTPPLNPRDNLGYFEYGENALADAHLEDTDDYMGFTAKAPEGQPFTGRMWIAGGSNAINPVTITSEFAEIIYFLRNGNLYRRVLLVAPEKQAAVAPWPIGTNFNPVNMFGGGLGVSWLGVNDLSARPPMSSSSVTPILNTLGDLTNRQNRFARPRFSNDYWNTAAGNRAISDGVADDNNFDGVPDYYPTLFPNAFAAGLVNEVAAPPSPGVRQGGTEILAFPFIYPGAYSRPDASFPYGWIRGISIGPPNTDSQLTNHAPLASGDSLVASVPESFWGFPTWRETLSTNWRDPAYSISPSNTVQAIGLQSRDRSVVPPAPAALTWFGTNGLPQLDPNNPGTIAARQPLRPELTAGPAPTNSDNLGGLTFLVPNAASRAAGANPNMVWEDDLIMTNVRSFDIKAYDESAPGFVDLGWGNAQVIQTDDPTLLAVPTTNFDLNSAAVNRFLAGTPFRLRTNNRIRNTVLETFAHEGRIPPLINDLRSDPQAPGFNVGVGDSGTPLPTTIRLRRVWDTWSTDYTNAPSLDINSYGYPYNSLRNLPFNQQRPVYPSFPPPYPMPLRGIQITIRVNDAANERVKTLTIRHDFSDRL